MKYGSVCSGVEAATLAWETLGWKASFFSEIEAFPSAVLEQRWPEVPNLGDFTKIENDNYNGKIDLLTGGTPCQAFSIAGAGRGIEDQRGQLSLEFAKLAFRSKARWIVWENVPGVLSSNKGQDFAAFLSLLCGWNVKVPRIHTKQNGEKVRKWRKSGIITPAPGGFGLAWRTIDAQFVRVDGYNRAVPQRRRRLFVVGYIGDWIRPATVLFDKGSLSGGSAPERKTRQSFTRTAKVSASGRSRSEVICMAHGQANAEVCENHASTLNCNHEAPIVYENHPAGSRVRPSEDVCQTLNARMGTGGGNLPFVQCFTQNDAAHDAVDHIAPTMRCGGTQAVSICREYNQSGSTTWREWFRLQSRSVFPL